MNLRTKMRVGDVVRWHIVRTARPQTLAEHLYRTWLLATELHARAGLPASTLQHTQHWALTHDLPEVLIGDMPTPVKRTIEARAQDPDIWKKLERDLAPDSGQLLVVDTPTAYVVKIADCLEGWGFLYVEGVGGHADDTKVRLSARALATATEAAIDFPAYKWAEATRAVLAELSAGKVEHCE